MSKLPSRKSIEVLSFLLSHGFEKVRTSGSHVRLRKGNRLVTVLRRFFLSAIRFYQHYLSFDTGILKFLFLTDKACRFTPTCSQYIYEAVSRYGIITGLSLGVRRILRCHPWNKGGYDPVPKPKIKDKKLKIKDTNKKSKI